MNEEWNQIEYNVYLFAKVGKKGQRKFDIFRLSIVIVHGIWKYVVISIDLIELLIETFEREREKKPNK